VEQATCRTDECERPILSSGLCGRCYHRAWRVKNLPPRALGNRHVVSEVDRDTLIGTCCLCGPTKATWRSTRKYYESAGTVTVKRLETKKVYPISPEARRRHRLRVRYGLTLEQYDEMYARAGGACEICGAAFPTLCVDHDHGTGAVRGLLCTRCNQGLGHFGDDPGRITAARTYLIRAAEVGGLS
jgi:hypothetical protein